MATALGSTNLRPNGPYLVLFIPLEKSFYNGTILSYILHSCLQERYRGVFSLLGAAQSYFVIKVCWAKILSWLFPFLLSKTEVSKPYLSRAREPIFSALQARQLLSQLLSSAIVAGKQPWTICKGRGMAA